jgi:hypothetical protein
MIRCTLVRNITPYADELEGFLKKCAGASTSILGYHYPLYIEMLEKIGIGEPFCILVNDESQLIGYLPGFIKSSNLGAVYSSMPFFGPNAGLIYEPTLSNIDQIHSEVFDFLFKNLKDLDIVSASIYSPFMNEKVWELYDRSIQPTHVIDKFTSFIDLDNLELNTSLQYDIRKAQRSNVEIRTECSADAIKALYDIYKKNCLDYGIPLKPMECIEFLMNRSNTNSTTETYLAYHQNELIGGLIMMYSDVTASYYLPCSIHEFRSLQPTTLLIKHAMDMAQQRGLKIWNWESSPSKESGVFKFKMKWGSQDGSYKIYVKSFRNPDFFRQLGSEEISRNFPFFFVYPFNLL